MFPKYFIIHSIILTCQKLEINTKNTILQAKRNPNIVIIFYSRRQLGTTEPGNTNGGGRGEQYCTNNASDFNKHQKCFLQKLDNWLTFAYWVCHFFSVATITWRMWWFDLMMMMMSLTNDDDDDKDDIKTIKTIILSLQVTSIISAFSSN